MRTSCTTSRRGLHHGSHDNRGIGGLLKGSCGCHVKVNKLSLVSGGVVVGGRGDEGRERLGRVGGRA